jgi:hypothetical protein
MDEDSPAWEAALFLIGLLTESQVPYRQRIKQIIERSSELLHPLSEPLLVDSQLTIMLSKSREEVYSDWLAWSFERLGDVQCVFRVLGVQEPVKSVHAGAPLVKAHREYYVPSGHEGSSGRLDMRLFTGREPIADIEVKLALIRK